jgi:hypothetical protein
MLDTVIVWFPVSPTQKQLQGNWVGHPLIFPDGKNLPKYFQNAKMDNGTLVKFKYYPPNPPHYPLPWLSIQVSLPKVLYGNNVQMITKKSDIGEAIQRVNQFLGRLSWLPSLDIGSGTLWQVDLAYNHPVGEYVQDYVRALLKLDYPKRHTKPYPHEGVQFLSGVGILKFYDKLVECSMPDAYGYLRQESVLRHTYYIGRMMGIEYPTLKDIAIPWITGVLQKDLQKLHLTRNIITDRSTAQAMLVKIYGWSQGDKLFGHLYARQSMSEEQMISSGMSARTIRKYKKQITDVGIALTLCDDGMQLAPLEIKLTDGTYVPNSLSDT